MTLDVSEQDVVITILAGNNETLGLLQDGIGQDTTNATAHDIAQAIVKANVSSTVLAQALEAAIAQSIADVEDGADPAIIIQAAVLVNQTQAVLPGFNMVTSSSRFYCRSCCLGQSGASCVTWLQHGMCYKLPAMTTTVTVAVGAHQA